MVFYGNYSFGVKLGFAVCLRLVMLSSINLNPICTLGDVNLSILPFYFGFVYFRFVYFLSFVCFVPIRYHFLSPLISLLLHLINLFLLTNLCRKIAALQCILFSFFLPVFTPVIMPHRLPN